jgi:UPF0716 protein FxsA
MIIFLALVITPLVEIAVFIEVGGFIGLWPTLFVVIITAIAGTWLLRSQGWGVMNRARVTLGGGEFPAREVFDGACILVAGALLLTPGFVTDTAGLLLFVPAVRAYLGRVLLRYLMSRGNVDIEMFGGDDRRREKRDPGGGIIEGEFHEVPNGPDDREPNHRGDDDRAQR